MLGQLNVLSFKGIDARVSTFIKAHNELNTSLSTKIRITRQSALRNIVNAYRNYIFSYKNNKDWETKSTIPEMPTRRCTMASMIGCGQKTAYNHIIFLIKAGVLIKQFHGSNSDFGVYLNPYFWLSEAEELPKVDLKKSTLTDPFALSLSRFLPHISSQDIQEINNYYKEGVENVEKVSWKTSQTASPHFQRNSSDVFSGKSSEQSGFLNEKQLKTQNPEKEKFAAAAADLSTQNSQSVDNQGNSEKIFISQGVENAIREIEDKSNGAKTVGGNESLMTSEVPPPTSSNLAENEQEAWSLVKRFTDYSLKHIYQSNEFNKSFFISPAQYHEIKNLIMNDVFGNFHNSAKDVWRIRQAYTDAILAVDTAVKYARKNNWTSFLHPKAYFSKAFHNSGKRGSFFDVLKWQQADKKKLKEVQCLDFVEKAKYHVQFTKSPRGRKDLTSRLEISNFMRLQVAKKCGAFYLSIYNQWLSNPSNFK